MLNLSIYVGCWSISNKDDQEMNVFWTKRFTGKNLVPDCNTLADRKGKEKTNFKSKRCTLAFASTNFEAFSWTKKTTRTK